ncbi:pimeloyl-ACP methyl ester carboxylesterase [Paenibacillus anaericanus]|uniref:alpha/beta fold hydrolase n=1 Tax=Paenibacillus anaericanus TaxID=170367 RepID=UPI0027812979|nr:alpha/beta fold hydrolase [Paenibacillus anaericanus]MDQ0091181.1 pimeloyl-ACP methyl ester carboxylesterase [Paenibacillus anaericanus]
MKIYRSKKAEEHLLITYDQLLGMWGVNYEECDIQTRYGSTHVILCGESEKPILVLFHGVGDDSAMMWVYNAKYLAEHFRIIAIDTMGGPGKSRPNSEYGKGFDRAIWIDEVLDGLAVDDVSMAGTSNGAYLIQYYAVARPERVKRIVCLAGSVPASGGNVMKVMFRIFLPEALFPTKRNIERLVHKLLGANSDAFLKNDNLMEHFKWLLKGFNNMAMSYHKFIPLSDHQIASLRDKSLYLIGEEDPFAQMGGKEALIRYGMNVRFYEQVGHGINHEIANEINTMMIEYLGDGNHTPLASI